jgi:hypothetical protein
MWPENAEIVGYFGLFSDISVPRIVTATNGHAEQYKNAGCSFPEHFVDMVRQKNGKHGINLRQ